MDAKSPLLPQAESPEPSTPSRRGPRRCTAFHISAVAVILGLFWLATTWQCQDAKHTHEETETKRVPLEIHIMSKCPDARDCLQKLVLPTMQNASDKVDFQLSYIGRVTDDDDGVQCMHGQTECLGNILELCAASLYPDPKIYLGFTMCMSRNYKDIPNKDMVEDCALEHGISFDKLNDCVSQDDGAYAMDMLRGSVARSAQLNVTKSCTIRLNDEVRCIMDGGKWSDCDEGSRPADLIGDINKIYDSSREVSD